MALRVANPSKEIPKDVGEPLEDEKKSVEHFFPETEEWKKHNIDAILAQELNQLSMKERELICEEIHGVDEIIEETPEFIYERLATLDQELHKISFKPAYEQAKKMSETYVTDYKFRLMFLRADSFDPNKAATRLVKFMEEKLKMFGQETLVRPLYLSDLNEDDRVCLKAGALQALPVRDRAGRTVLGNFRNLIPRCYKEVDNMLKTLAYLFISAVEDEETQKRGVVSILYTVGPRVADYNGELLKRSSEQRDWVPVRVNSVHVCFNDPLLRTLEPIVLLCFGKEGRARVRMHYGTHTECQYSLMTFGVPVQFVPVSYEGELKTGNHNKWLAKREARDNGLKRMGWFDGLDLPARNDVLLGRGKPFQDHPGNICMRNLVELHIEEYQIAPMGQKNVMAAKIVQATQLHGRFVKKRPDGWWEEVNDADATMKVLKTFRTARALQSKPGSKSRSVQVENRKRASILQQPKRNLPCLGSPCWDGNA